MALFQEQVVPEVWSQGPVLHRPTAQSLNAPPVNVAGSDSRANQKTRATEPCGGGSWWGVREIEGYFSVWAYNGRQR